MYAHGRLKSVCFQYFGGEAGSPVSDDGCGLKPDDFVLIAAFNAGSPVSDDGCGLKPSTIGLPGTYAEGIARQ